MQTASDPCNAERAAVTVWTVVVQLKEQELAVAQAALEQAQQDLANCEAKHANGGGAP